MARIEQTGFDMQNEVADNVTLSGTGAAYITTTTRNGLGAMLSAGNNNVTNTITKVIGSGSYTELYIAFGLRMVGATSGDRFQIRDSSNNNLLKMTSATADFPTFTIGAATSIGTSSVNVGIATLWNHIQIYFKLDASVGSITIKINGTTALTYSGNTNPSTYGNINNFVSISTANAGRGQAIDDWVVNDASGGADNSWPGDRYFVMLLPNGNGNANQFVGSDADSTNNYLLVDDPNDNDADTTYVQSATVAQVDQYATGDITLDGSDIIYRAIPFVVLKRANAAVAGNARIGVRTQATNYWGSDFAVSSNYTTYYGDVYLTNPNTTVAWTDSDVDAIQVGLEVRS